MTEIIQNPNFYGKALVVVGTDANGDNRYEVRGKRALYIGERDPMQPTIVRFVQGRHGSFRSQYGDRHGQAIDFSNYFMTGRLINTFTDIDGPLVAIGDLGFEDAHEVPSPAVALPSYEFI